MSPFDKMKKFEHEFAENMAEGFWTPQDPLSEVDKDRLEHVQRDLDAMRNPDPEQPSQ